MQTVNLGIGADGRLAVLAGVGEQRLVALDAERFLVAQDVAVAGQVQVAVEAREHRRVRLHRALHAPPSRPSWPLSLACLAHRHRTARQTSLCRTSHIGSQR